MDDTLRKFHGQKVWQLNPYTCIKDIELRATYDNEDAFTYMVFNFPYSVLRGGATSFCDFKPAGRAAAMKDAFLFYLKLVERVCSYGKDAVSAKVACFLETVQKDGISIGVRVWLFSNRRESAPHSNCINLIMDNKKMYDDLQKKTPKVEVKLASHQTWMKCKSLHDYLKVISTYSNNEYNLLDCEDIQETIRGPESPHGPASIFSVNNQGFMYDFGSTAENTFPQNDIRNYTDDSGVFQFPNEKLVLRCNPEELTVTELFIKKKYLPSYFFEKVRLPSCEVTDVGELGTQKLVTVPDHIHRRKKIDGRPIIDIIREYDINNQNSEASQFLYGAQIYKQRIEPILRTAFVINNTDPNDEEPAYKDKGVGKFLRHMPKYKPKKKLSEVWFTDVLTDMKKDPSTKTLLADKFSLDTLDMMKYKQELLEEYHLEDRRAFQVEMMDEFIQTVVKDINCNVSEPVQQMLHWFNNVYKPDMRITRRKTDPNGSVFLNSIVNKLNFYDEDLQVSTGHPTLMLLQHAKYDTYRQELNLHFNAIFTGEGATSKSYLFEKMKQMSIPATIVELTYQTKRANAVEKDQNDVITVFNEAPAGLFMSNNGKDGDKEQEAAFKEKLTSQITRCNTFMRDEETDKRDNRTTISQAIGTYFGATNDDPSAASEAMSTRFYWGEFEKVERKNKTIDMCMRGERAWQDIGRDDLNRTLHNLHLEHFQMMLLYKLMFVGIIKYPTLDVSDFIYERIVRSLRAQNVETSTRFKERYDIMCQIFTMCNALDTVYNFEGGIHAEEAFDPATLLDVEPYLYCTEEIAIFCFTLLSNEVYSPSETKIIKAVWKLWKKAGGSKFEKNMLEDGTQSVNYAYIKLNKTGLKLIQCIQQAIPNVEGKPSEHNIKAALKKLKKKSYKTYPMVHATIISDISQRKYNDGHPEREPGKNHMGETDGMREDTESYFNIELFHKLRRHIDHDPISTAIGNTRHKHTKVKKLLCGCPNRNNAVISYPSVFKILDQKPAITRIFTRKNPLYKTQASQSIRQHNGYQLKEEERHKGSVLTTDFDCWGCLEHAKKLKIPKEKWPDFYMKYNHELVEDTITSCPEEHQINYPTDVIAQIEARHNNTENDNYVDTYSEFDFDGINNQTRAQRLRIE